MIIEVIKFKSWLDRPEIDPETDPQTNRGLVYVNSGFSSRWGKDGLTNIKLVLELQGDDQWRKINLDS